MFSFFRKKKSTPPPDSAPVAEMKELWFRYGGRTFVMFREEPEAYERFDNARIPDETVEEWRQEMIESEFTALTEGDPTRRWIVASHLLELIGNTRTRTEERYVRLLDILYGLADSLDTPQRILILEQFTDRNVPKNNGAILAIHRKAPALTPKMSDTLRRLADFSVSDADNRPDSPGWSDVPARYREALDGIRDAYGRHGLLPD